MALNQSLADFTPEDSEAGLPAADIDSGNPLDQEFSSEHCTCKRSTPPQISVELQNLFAAAIKYDCETESTIRLVPTEGLMSPLQRLMGLSAQQGRYLHAPPENHSKAILYPDIGGLQAIYDICRKAGQELLHAKYVLPDYLSGMQAMQSIILAFTAPNDLIVCVAPEDGGHEVTPQMISVLGRSHCCLTVKRDSFELDLDAIPPETSPQLVYFNQSNIILPQDIGALRRRFPDATIVFDISQIMALVAGGEFPNPLDQGADVIIGSTHKSMNGPQKAVAATNNQNAFEALQKVNKIFVSNNHPADTAALAVCFLEFKEFGREYAKQLVINANALARALGDFGVPVYHKLSSDSFTKTQHVWIDCAKIGLPAVAAIGMLKDSGIIANTLYLARGGKDNQGERGLRLGTTEVTRLGMREREMEMIATAIAAVLRDSEPQHSDAIRCTMQELRSRFNTVQYCCRTPEQMADYYLSKLR